MGDTVMPYVYKGYRVNPLWGPDSMPDNAQCRCGNSIGFMSMGSRHHCRKCQAFICAKCTTTVGVSYRKCTDLTKCKTHFRETFAKMYRDHTEQVQCLVALMIHKNQSDPNFVISLP